MENTINIIMDFSGSMTELGKSSVLKSMVFHLHKIASNKDTRAKFFLWQDAIIPFTNNWKDFSPTGKATPIALKDFIANQPPSTKYLLLSDGIGDIDSATAIHQVLVDSGSVLIAVAIGRDTEYNSLAEIAYDKTVWYAADILQAMDYLCHGIDGVEPT